ncbi:MULTISPECIES: YegP family protein [Niastella]|uniref:YegP family protein n=1 Tax=Niastella soli TaxID=2821487 RepID=A0ABS3Z1R8_9BACT|nr:YegP family protein [Niastella soli]MBO9204104.1 YegP family protein [Niastella soli]
MGKFVITKRVDGDFQFSLKAGNGETILYSEGYSSRSTCQNGIDSVKTNASDDNKYDLRVASNGKLFFILEAANGQTIGISELYESETSRHNGILSVKKNAPDAIIQDATI